MNNKGISLLPVILFVFAVLIVGAVILLPSKPTENVESPIGQPNNPTSSKVAALFSTSTNFKNSPEKISATQIKSFKEFENKEYGFKFEYPADAHIYLPTGGYPTADNPCGEINSQANCLIMIQTANAKFSNSNQERWYHGNLLPISGALVEIAIFSTPSNFNSLTWQKELIDNTQRHKPPYPERDHFSVATSTLNDVPVVLAIYNGTQSWPGASSQDQIPNYLKEIAVWRGGKIISISFITRDETKSEYGTLLDTILSSIKFSK